MLTPSAQDGGARPSEEPQLPVRSLPEHAAGGGSTGTRAAAAPGSAYQQQHGCAEQCLSQGGTSDKPASEQRFQHLRPSVTAHHTPPGEIVAYNT